MYKALKDNKIIAVNEVNYFACMEIGINIDEIVEDTKHTVKDYIQCDGEYILNDDERVIELQKQHVIAIRDEYFNKYVDWYQSKPLLWEEMTAKEKQLIGDYRIYLRDYDDRELWWEQEPMTYDEWIERKN